MCKFKKLPLKKGNAFLITDKKTRSYFLGEDIEEGVLAITKKGLTVFADSRYILPARNKATNACAECVLYNGLQTLSDFFIERDIKRIYVDYDKTTVSEYKQYKTLGVSVLNGNKYITLSRSLKTQEERQKIKRACDITFKAYKKTLKHVKEGITELQLKQIIERYMVKLGADGIAFDTIVAFGENSAVPHHQSGKTILKKNVPVLIDVGCEYKGYASDLTRTVFFGSPSQKFIDCYSAVLKANQTAVQNIKAGLTGKQADDFARNTLKEYDLDKYFTHSLGHGVGLDIHEYPRLSPKSQNQLEEDMVFTIEPGVYLEGEFGIRIEDTVELNGNGVKRYFTDDKNLVIL